jgi:hypothetical protein
MISLRFQQVEPLELTCVISLPIEITVADTILVVKANFMKLTNSMNPNSNKDFDYQEFGLFFPKEYTVYYFCFIII